MKLGDKIRLHIERTPTFGGEPEVTDGVFTVIQVSRGLSHCFGKHMYSEGFNSFDYGEEQEGRPDIVRLGSIYVPLHSMLDEPIMKDLHHDKKKVSWEIITPPLNQTKDKREQENG